MNKILLYSFPIVKLNAIVLAKNIPSRFSITGTSSRHRRSVYANEILRKYSYHKILLHPYMINLT